MGIKMSIGGVTATTTTTVLHCLVVVRHSERMDERPAGPDQNEAFKEMKLLHLDKSYVSIIS